MPTPTFVTNTITSNLPVLPEHVLQIIQSLTATGAYSTVELYRAGRTNFGRTSFSSNALVEMASSGGYDPLTVYAGQSNTVQSLKVDAATGKTVINSLEAGGVSGSGLTIVGNSTLTGTSTLAASSYPNGLLRVESGLVRVGDLNSSVNGTLIAVDDVGQTVTINAANGLTVAGGVTGNFIGNVLGNLTGNVIGNVVGNVTGNLTGTASLATNAVTADTATTATTASHAINALTASYALTSAGTITNAISASYSTTASYALNAANSNITLVAGPGISVNGYQITASLRTINGIAPTNGNVAVSLTGVITGLSSSNYGPNLVASSSGAITASFTTGSIWVVSGETGSLTSGSNGLVYIFATSASRGVWNRIAPLDQAAGDQRYLILTPQSQLFGNLNLGTNNITNVGTVTATSFIGTASWASQAVTASYITIAQTASYVLNAVSASIVSTASYVNPLTQNVTLVGNLTQTGSATISGSLLVGETTPYGAGYLTVTSFVTKSDVSNAVFAISSTETGNDSIATPLKYPTQLTFNQLGATNGWSIQSTNQGVGYTPLVLNPVGGIVSIATLVATGSLFGTASYADNAATASYVAVFPYTGSAAISGSLTVDGPITATSASVSGNVITNISDTFTSTAAVTKIVTLSSAEYTGLATKDANTLYIVI